MYEQAASDNDFGVPLSWVSLLDNGSAILKAVKTLVDFRLGVEDACMGA